MSKTFLFAFIVLAIGLFFPARTFAQDVDLTPYLQAEVNEIAMLTAQSNYLQQQGDPLGAALVASYVPDHQMQASFIAAQISAQGGNPSQIVANETPFLGSRAVIMAHDIDAHRKAIDDYNALEDKTDNAVIDTLALLGSGGASRHFASLQVAQGATLGTPSELTEGLVFALTLERATIANLQTQAARLTALGDPTTANTLLSFVPQHEQQANCLTALVVQMGGDPAKATPPQAVALATRDQIMASLRTSDTQLLNTYAIPAAMLPQSPIRQVFLQGQSIVMASLSRVQGIPVPV